MNPPKYLIDTSILMRRSKHDTYAEESFPIHWENFDRLVLESRIISVPSVLKEIENLSEEIYEWAKNHSRMFKPPDEKFGIESNRIKSIFPGWYYSKNEDELWADRDLIIHAKAHNMILVTLEGYNPRTIEKNHKIPTICEKLGAYCEIKEFCTKNIDSSTPFQCIDFAELVKREALYELR